MRFPENRAGWYAMAKQSEMGSSKPVRRFLFDIPIVIFGTKSNPSAMVDRCPHRGAPLSAGKVKGETIQCGFHGWSFDASGTLVDMPCLVEKLPSVKAETLETCVHLGLVFVKVGDAPDRPYSNPLMESVKFWRPLPGGANCSLADAAENFLDPTHTVFVHKHLVRASGKANRTKIAGSGKDNMAEIRYYGEGDAGGIVGKMMGEKERALSVGRFVGPNVAEVEFHGAKSVNFVMTGFITPVDGERVEGYGVVGLPGNWLWARIKFWILYPWIRLVHHQDKKALGKLTRNRKLFARHKDIVSSLDIMRPQIDAILNGEKAPAEDNPFETSMDL